MSALLDEVERGWAVLSVPEVSELASFPLSAKSEGASCRVAVDRQGQRHLLVPARDGFSTETRTGENLNLLVRTLKFGDFVASHVDIYCADSDLSEEFDEVILDVLDAIEGVSDAAAAAVAAVNRWRRLFRSRTVRGLSAEERRGLFLELSVLLAALKLSSDARSSIWTGPLKEPHDFELPDRCVECKAVSAMSTSIVVHGIQQLASHDDKRLLLVLATVLEDTAGTTLDEVVEELVATVNDADDLRKRLAATGWSKASYVERYLIDVIRVVDVDSTTPSLGPSDLVTGALDEGVSRLSYRVELDALYERSVPSTLAEILAG